MDALILRVGLALPLVAVLSWLCAAVAQSYAYRVRRGASVDAFTLWEAARTAVQSGAGASEGRRCLTFSTATLLIAALPFLYEPSAPGALRWGACVVLLLLAHIDSRCGLLPDALTLPLLWLGLFVAWSGLGVDLHDALLATALGYGVLWAMALIFSAWRGIPGMGGGDMKLFAAIGAWVGWQALPALLLFACLSGLLFVAIAHRGNILRRSFAFGPHLAWVATTALAGFPVVQYFFI